MVRKLDRLHELVHDLMCEADRLYREGLPTWTMLQKAEEATRLIEEIKAGYLFEAGPIPEVRHA